MSDSICAFRTFFSLPPFPFHFSTFHRGLRPPPTMSYSWDSTFAALFNRCLERYRSGDEDFDTYYTGDDLAFLESIGYQKREFFDFVEDFADGGDPSLSTAILVASARRDYLRHVMKGETSERVLDPASLPAKTDELAGFVWLPRILAKARAKLRGELDPNTMYGCGGDRNFLSTHDLAPADFLRAVWAAGDDDDAVIDYVRQYSNA